MAHFKKSRQAFLQGLNEREKARWEGLSEPCSHPVGPREPSGGKAWIQVCSQPKPADQGHSGPPRIKAPELGGVALPTRRETSSGAGDGEAPQPPLRQPPQATALRQPRPHNLRPVPGSGEGPLLPTFYRNLPSHKSCVGAKRRISQATALTRPCFLITSFLLIK